MTKIFVANILESETETRKKEPDVEEVDEISRCRREHRKFQQSHEFVKKKVYSDFQRNPVSSVGIRAKQNFEK